MKFYRSLILPLGLYSLTALAAPGAHGPNGEHLAQSSNKASGAMGRQSNGIVFLPMHHQALLSIKTQFVTDTHAQRHTQLDAVVKHHPDGYAKIQSSSDGRLDASSEGIRPSGSRVQAGDILGLIRYQDTAYEFASQTSELIAIRNQISQTQRDVIRLKTLGELASKQGLEQLETELFSLKQQANALQSGLEKPEFLIAPISGVLINHDASRGQWVEAGETIFEIISPNQYVIEATTSHHQLSLQVSAANIEEQPNLSLNYIGHAPKQVNGLTLLNFELADDTHESNLFVDQRVSLRVQTNETRRGIILPEDAIVLSQNNLPQVWIKLSAEQFLPQLIQYESLQPGFVLVTQGLGAGNRVVVEGASLLNQVR
ncbi:HlyD family efflux transporter periplasmic adaptor subunit [Pseudoalteromonas sp. SMS1]|uniref:efflux RND transporter periplasmic adaptor subunit n=1 Tax=Pseudoalteromonas sp. SMS1 TaxID=2908894 RepID=UPI001F46D6A3|nr:HlyD family efflux transporter periplasmic adaptor subunit [Pseudoalteromonas sp. SMS1]MCF2856091.1 HlyD family efflux transporter periplasmic adaptor subunit [Pseudoalteromonas sp. SMS1]